MKQSLSILFSAMLATGISGAVSAGHPPDVEVDCGGEKVYDCLGTDRLWEIELKCEGGWEGDVWLWDENGDAATWDLSANNCDQSCDNGGAIGSFKTEVKCQLPGSPPKPQKGGDKVELEIKEIGPCPPG